MSRARLFYESVRHTQVRQLAARLALTVRRRLLRRAPALGDRRAVLPPADVPEIAARPPQPLFPQRLAMVNREGGRWHARFLNRGHDLSPPVAWHDPALDVGTRLELLNLHYMEYLEAVDDAAFTALVSDWIERNPPYRGIFWLGDWNAYALSIRVVVWMQQWARRALGRSGPMPDRVAGSLARQLVFLEKNVENDIGGNHILKNAKALLWAGAFFTGREAARWSAQGAAILERELPEQLLPDGVHFERSPAYHAQVTADLLECLAVHPPGASRDLLERKLAEAASALCDLCHPDGMPGLFNDGGLHMTYPVATVLQAVAERLGRTFSPRSVFAYPDAGYYGARGGETYALVDCGAIGPDHLPAHAHGDVLAFEWTVSGRRIIVDTGVVAYDAGPKRDRSRATAAHNTLTLDDADQAEFWSAFRVGRRPRVHVSHYDPRADGFALEGFHDGYARLGGSPRHVRRFDVRPGAIQVDDRVVGGAGQRALTRLLLAPGLDGTRSGSDHLISGEGVRVRLRTTAAVTVVDAPYWPDFGVELRARQIVLDYGTAPCAGGFALEVES